MSVWDSSSGFDASPSADPRAEFHDALRRLYQSAGAPPLRTISRHAHVSASTVSDLLRGARLPSWDITASVVRFLGGEEPEWRERWQKARDQARARPGNFSGQSAQGPPDPAAASSVEEFAVQLRRLKEASGLSYREIEAAASEDRVEGRLLSRSTIAEVLTGARSIPSPEFVAAFVSACGDIDADKWVAALKRLQGAESEERYYAGLGSNQLSAEIRRRVVVPPKTELDFADRQDVLTTRDYDSLRRNIRWQWHRTAQLLVFYAGTSGLALVFFVLTRELGLPVQTAVKLSLACLACGTAGFFSHEFLSVLGRKRQSRPPNRSGENVGPGTAAGKAYPPGARLDGGGDEPPVPRR